MKAVPEAEQEKGRYKGRRHILSELLSELPKDPLQKLFLLLQHVVQELLGRFSVNKINHNVNLENLVEAPQHIETFLKIKVNELCMGPNPQRRSQQEHRAKKVGA